MEICVLHLTLSTSVFLICNMGIVIRKKGASLNHWGSVPVIPVDMDIVNMGELFIKYLVQYYAPLPAPIILGSFFISSGSAHFLV